MSERAALEYVTQGEALAHFTEVFDLYPAQRRFMASERYFNLFLAGIGAGKTWSLMLLKLRNALANPRCHSGLGGRTMVGDVKKVLLPVLEEHCETFRAATGIELVKSVNQQLGTTTLINDHVIDWFSYDRIAKVRGYTWSDAVLDEVEHAVCPPEQALAVVTGRLREPRAKLRQLGIATTPNGMRGAVGQFVEAQRAGSVDHHIAHATIYDNPHLPAEQIKVLESSFSSREFRQECMGEVLMPTSGVFVEYDEARHVVPWRGRLRGDWILAIDWDPNFYACAIEIRTTSEDPYHYQWVVSREWRYPEVGPMEARQAIKDILREAHDAPRLIACDRNPKVQRQWLQSAYRGETWVKSCENRPGSVKERIRQIAFMLDPPQTERPLLVLSDELDSRPGEKTPVMRLRDAMIALQHTRHPDGSMSADVERNTPPTHAVDALAYAVDVSKAHPEFHGGHPLRVVFGDALRAGS